MLTMLIQASGDFVLCIAMLFAIPWLILHKGDPFPPKVSPTDFTEAV